MFKDKAGNFSPFRLVGLILVVVFAVIFLSSSFVVIPAGHTGVALTFGKVEDNVLQEGLHFKVPFVQKIVVVDNRIVKLDVNTEAFSKDLQTITTVVAVRTCRPSPPWWPSTTTWARRAARPSIKT